MCVMCALPSGSEITQKEFETCWNSNPDGGGFSYLDENSNFVTVKSLDYDEFRASWIYHHSKHGKNSPFILHFRAASHGEINVDNCHPFKVNQNYVMAHNGTLNKVPLVKKEGKPDGRSDTKTFVEDYLSVLPSNFNNNNTIRTFLIDFIGTNNKLIFLDKRGAFTIYNKSSGIDDNNRWFSNDMFKNFKDRSRTNSASWDATSFLPTIAPTNTSDKSKIKTYAICLYCKSDLITSSLKDKYATDLLCIDCGKILDKLAKETGETEYTTKKIMKEVSSAHTFTKYYNAQYGEPDKLEKSR